MCVHVDYKPPIENWVGKSSKMQAIRFIFVLVYIYTVTVCVACMMLSVSSYARTSMVLDGTINTNGTRVDTNFTMIIDIKESLRVSGFIYAFLFAMTARTGYYADTASESKPDQIDARLKDFRNAVVVWVVLSMIALFLMPDPHVQLYFLATTDPWFDVACAFMKLARCGMLFFEIALFIEFGLEYFHALKIKKDTDLIKEPLLGTNKDELL